MTDSVTKLIVFSGSKEGNNPAYKEAAVELGRLVGAETSIREVYYGGGFSGLMGAFAAASARSKPDIRLNGVFLPAFALVSAPEDIAANYHGSVAPDLSRRKGAMVREGEIAIVLAGGIGTFDELWEIVAEQDVKYHADPQSVMQPTLLLNTNNYYAGMIAQVRKAVEEGFIDPVRARFIAPVNTPREAVDLLNRISQSGRWSMNDFMNRPSVMTAENPFYVPPPPRAPGGGMAPAP